MRVLASFRAGMQSIGGESLKLFSDSDRRTTTCLVAPAALKVDGGHDCNSTEKEM